MDMNMDFVDQRQEHDEYEAGVMSELQNAFQHSRNTVDLTGDANKIKLAQSEGWFVAVMEIPVFCPSTDAILGNKKILLGVARNAPTATRMLQRFEDPEVNLYVAHPEVKQ